MIVAYVVLSLQFLFVIFIYDFNMQRRRKMLLSLMLLETKMEVINIFDYYYGLKSFFIFYFCSCDIHL